ncbi:MAG TPA: FKBP-type peptidyl-prolyl cis-trans isomerase [Longimicrobiales bacterium]|nr:FKBP-type peptidyl-prolyl cis-trans isomerase [Longimicrobiales bacterium]
MIPRFTMSFALAALIAAGCASTPLATPDDVMFAPSLNVDLAQMERLPSGVYVRDLREGAGGVVQRGQRVAVHFVGWLADGTQFDGVAPPSPPVQFQLGAGEVIRGWDDGIAGMRAGGQRMIVVPAARGYGRQRTGNVPPNSVLVFVVEVVR